MTIWRFRKQFCRCCYDCKCILCFCFYFLHNHVFQVFVKTLQCMHLCLYESKVVCKLNLTPEVRSGKESTLSLTHMHKLHFVVCGSGLWNHREHCYISKQREEVVWKRPLERDREIEEESGFLRELLSPTVTGPQSARRTFTVFALEDSRLFSLSLSLWDSESRIYWMSIKSAGDFDCHLL